MAIPVSVIIAGAIEAIKLGSELLETWQNNPTDQAELEKRWNAMQARYRAADAAWEASKGE